MMASSLIFGLSSYNIFNLFKENLNLIYTYGTMAILDGALQELFLLLFYGVISLSAYVVFKACEKTLVGFLTEDKKK